MAGFTSRELFFFHHPDCGFCKVAEPVLEKWSAKHPEVVVVKLNVAYKNWDKYGFRPKTTPAYLYAVDHQARVRFEGALVRESQVNDLVRQGG